MDQGAMDRFQSGSSHPSAKAPKRKRLTKACDPCHKNKRRCDGYMPCGNCWHAEKECAYTDNAGHPVPAPLGRAHHHQPPNASQQQLQQGTGLAAPALPTGGQSDGDPRAHPVLPPISLPASAAGPSPARLPPPTHPDSPEREYFRGGGQLQRPVHAHELHEQARKRRAIEQAPSTSVLLVPRAAPPPPHPEDAPRSAVLRLAGIDPPLARELVTLFFAHCHPQMLMFHRPSFTAALAQSIRIPAHLLLAVCALAAPHCQHPSVRMVPGRLAGNRFAAEAKRIIFDRGRLCVERDLATAQALALLEMQQFVSSPTFQSDRQMQSLSMQILESLGMGSGDEAALIASGTSPPFSSVQDECIRRVFWVLYLVDLWAGIFLGWTPMDVVDRAANVRLPSDDANFDLSVPAAPEYLRYPSRPTPHASEFGHLLRIADLEWRSTVELRTLAGSQDFDLVENTVAKLRAGIDAWVATMPSHLTFSAENLRRQVVMFESGSNGGAWCFCMLHTMHAATVLGLEVATRREGHAKTIQNDWAVNQIVDIMDNVGSRARNSLLPFALWALSQCYGQNHPLLVRWATGFEEVWELKVGDLAESMLQTFSIDEPAAVERRRERESPVRDFERWAEQERRNNARAAADARDHPHNRGNGNSNGHARRYSQSRERDREWGRERRFTTGSEGSGIKDEAQTSPHTPATVPAMTRNQSLPSLKDSGLLDSWGEHGRSPPRSSASGPTRTSPREDRREARPYERERERDPNSDYRERERRSDDSSRDGSYSTPSIKTRRTPPEPPWMTEKR